jgi:hypothetical protein
MRRRMAMNGFFPCNAMTVVRVRETVIIRL